MQMTNSCTQQTIGSDYRALENFKGIGLVKSSFAQGFMPAISFKEEAVKK